VVATPTREPFAAETPATPTLLRLGDLLTAWEADAEAAHEALRTNTPRGPVTGLPRLDQELGGALAPGVHILHGNTGTGKTAYGLQTASACGCPCLFITTEMSPLELLRRHTARVTSTYLGKFKSGELLPRTSLDLVQQAIKAAPNLVLADATLVFPSPEWIRMAAALAKGDGRHLLIVLDSLHTWVDMAPGEADEYTRLNAGLSALRQIASALGCAVLATAERNRATMRAGGVNAGAGSRKIEYGAETVIDLERDQDAREDAAGEVPVTVKLAKNRNGAAGRKVELRFHGALQRFREV
jgi:replicative DNA helicase